MTKRAACGLVIVLLASLAALSAGPAARGAGGTPRSTRTIVSLTFDDGRRSQTAAVAILAAHRMHGTFFLNSDAVGNPYSISWSEAARIAAAGNEIGGHTLDHERLTDVSTAEARRQVCADRDALRAHGFDVSDFAYPYGSQNEEIRSIVQGCGYSSARGVGGLRSSYCPTCPIVETVPPPDLYLTRAVDDVLRTTTLQQMEDRVTSAEENGGGWLQFVFHDVCDGCSEYAISPGNLAAFLDWLAPRADRGTVVQTVAQTLGREQVAVASRSSAISNGLVVVLLALSALLFALAALGGRALRLAPGRRQAWQWVTTARFVAAAGGAALAVGAVVGWLS